METKLTAKLHKLRDRLNIAAQSSLTKSDMKLLDECIRLSSQEPVAWMNREGRIIDAMVYGCADEFGTDIFTIPLIPCDLNT